MRTYIFLLISLISFNSVLNAETKKQDANKLATSTSVILYSSKDEQNYKTLKTEIKGGVRKIFENINKSLPTEDFGPLPKGLSIIEGKGFKGIKLTQRMLDFRVYTWSDNTGLLDNYKKCKKEDEHLVAAVNGSFFSERGVLGQVIQDGKLPSIRQIPARLSRCFVCAYRDRRNVQYWYLGETPLSSLQIIQEHNKNMVWFNGQADSSVACDNLLGGGGWILKNRKDAHGEAVDRQFFRFRNEDKTSRKTVVAQDINRNLYFIVFEAGFSLHQVAREFVKNDIFKEIQDAIFLDGGSSSCIVLNGKYLVPPLYMVDKCRFSCIQIFEPEIIWE